jgi:asparagine synthase (glutamine-hydrolysing)
VCGIFGLASGNSKPVDIALINRATTLLRHRGPDDEGYLLGDTRSGRAVSCGGADTDPRLALPSLNAFSSESFNLAFGFRRLAILDLSPAGHQPMSSAEGRYWIVFNGEIYNYLELRAELEQYGFVFHSRSDTEVILAAYQRWGAGCLNRFTGMWALAIWDQPGQRLFLSRDPFGIKPLYYTFAGGTFAFASEIKALLQLKEVSHEVNPACLFNYLDSGLTDNGNETFFLDIKQIPPAHYMTVNLMEPASARPVRYWQIDLKQPVDLSFTDAAQKLRELFTDSVRLHLRSDVPVGSALSGGIDSSSIVSVMRRLHQDNLDIHSFSYAADDPSINEERWIDMVATENKAIIHKVHITQEELLADLDHLIATQDVPFGSTSIYAQHRVFRLAHEAGIKVMLDGQGADEFLAGYVIYYPSRLASLLRQCKFWQAIRFWRAATGYPNQYGIQLLAEACLKASPKRINEPLWGLSRRIYLSAPPGLKQFTRYLLQRRLALPTPVINQHWFRERGASGTISRVYEGKDILKSTLLQTLAETTLPALLRYEDRNSMTFSIESRVPFLTTGLVSFAFSLPEDFIIAADATTKAVFRQAMRDIVPDPILDRRDKIGFQTPEQDWLATLRPWVEGVLKSDAASQIPALNIKGMEEHWQQVLAGTQKFDWRIWRWLNLIRWAEQFDVSFR